MTSRLLAGCSLVSILAVALLGCDGGSDPRPASMRVRSVSGTYDLDGTTWVKCFPDEPEAGKSRRTIDTYASGRITHVEDVFDVPACAGTPDDSAHSTRTGDVDVGPGLAVGWNGAAPEGLADEVTASGVTYTEGGTTLLRTIAYVDDGAEPDRLYTGNEDGPLDGNGYPQQLEGAAALRE